MGYIRSYKVHDSLRNRDCRSIREAWEQYAPEVSYVTFRDRVKSNFYSYLTCTPDSFSMMEEVRVKGVWDPISGETWESISACAKKLGVTFQAVQLSIKRKGKCKGHLLEWAEDAQGVIDKYEEAQK